MTNKKINRNIAEALIEEQSSVADKKAEKKKRSRAKAKSGRIKADKRKK